MDTIDVSNLNRQFLFRRGSLIPIAVRPLSFSRLAELLALLITSFRPRDVGKPKAVIAAERVMERVAGVTVTAHYCRIEEKDPEWCVDETFLVACTARRQRSSARAEASAIVSAGLRTFTSSSSASTP